LLARGGLSNNFVRRRRRRRRRGHTQKPRSETANVVLENKEGQDTNFWDVWATALHSSLKNVARIMARLRMMGASFCLYACYRHIFGLGVKMLLSVFVATPEPAFS
jgi:hypothetical protein